jgi:peptidoglycan-N-acetylglucosamine deacetylase
MFPALAASAAALGLTGTCVYAALSAQSQLFGRALLAGSDPAQFALTFDDGPNEPYTLELLDLLAGHDVRATFFLIGQFVRQFPAIARQIHAAGHLIGNHTMTHPWLVLERPRRVRQELAACNAVIEDAIGAPVHIFRPPHGARRPDVLRIAADLGLTTVLWNAMGYDWKPISARQMAAHLERGIARNRGRGCGSNLLLHDGSHTAIGVDRSRSVAAARILLDRYPPGTVRYVTVDVWKHANAGQP